MSTMVVSVVTANITQFPCDVVVLKHAQGFYGADGDVAGKLVLLGITGSQLECLPGEHRLVDSQGALPAPLALFLGTVPLSSLRYHEIRLLAGRMLKVLEGRAGVRHVACTVHGTSFGLDEDEAVLALVGGLIEAFQRGVGPPSLERVTIVEKRAARAARLRLAVDAGLRATPGVTALAEGCFQVERLAGFTAAPKLATAGTAHQVKPHAFVAMPFSAELEDVFHYGISGPVKAAGLLCERVDQAIFDGLIIARIKERIETARVVVAELTGANPNVYLEVGYAWGLGRPTILLVRDVGELRFDVRAHRCLVYRSIRELEGLLQRELAAVLGP